MKQRRITKYKKVTLISAAKIRSAIKNNSMLCRYLGETHNTRISGWTRSSGYIQVDERIVDCDVEYPECSYANKAIVTNYIIADVCLYSDWEHCSKGWTKEHEVELQNILDGYTVTHDGKEIKTTFKSKVLIER